jgi:hypothetical protein
MSIASGLSAIIDAITITNSGKPIGRWPEAAKASARVSDNQKSFCSRYFIGSVALHNPRFGNGCPSGQALNGAGSALAGPKAKAVVLTGRLLYPLTARQQR